VGVLGEHTLIEQPFRRPAGRPRLLDELDPGPEPAAADGREVRSGEGELETDGGM